METKYKGYRMSEDMLDKVLECEMQSLDLLFEIWVEAFGCVAYTISQAKWRDDLDGE